MFFTKFQYRHDCAKLFQRFWTNASYKQQVCSLVNTEYFEKFLNCLINDMTYCLEEGIVKMEKIKKFEQRQETEPPSAFSKEDIDNNNQDRSICRANF